MNPVADHTEMIKLKNKTARPISLLWMLLYLPLHLLVFQFPVVNNCFLFLRLGFLTLVVGALLFRRNAIQIRDIFFGRWLHGRRDWAMALVFVIMLVLLRLMVSWLFHFSPPPLTLDNFVWEAIIPPINEEIVFRGLFLGALLGFIPHKPLLAVVLSTGIFVACHDLRMGPGPTLNLVLFICLLIQSMVYGACYVRTRCLPLCMVLHVLWNSILWLLPV